MVTIDSNSSLDVTLEFPKEITKTLATEISLPEDGSERKLELDSLNLSRNDVRWGDERELRRPYVITHTKHSTIEGLSNYIHELTKLENKANVLKKSGIKVNNNIHELHAKLVQAKIRKSKMIKDSEKASKVSNKVAQNQFKQYVDTHRNQKLVYPIEESPYQLMVKSPFSADYNGFDLQVDDLTSLPKIYQQAACAEILLLDAFEISYENSKVFLKFIKGAL